MAFILALFSKIASFPGGFEVFAREGAFAGAGDADEDDEGEVGDGDGHARSSVFV